MSVTFRAMESQDDWMWFKTRTSVIYCEDTVGIVAMRNGDIAAMCVFDSFSPFSCNVHLAIDDVAAIRAGLFTQVALYAYVTRGCERMFGLVPSNNEKALKLDKHIGFTEVSRVPRALGKDVDYIVMCLEREDCRWLPAQFKEEAA